MEFEVTGDMFLTLARQEAPVSAAPAPARTPEAVIATLNREINNALASPALKARLDAEGALADPMSPQAFGSMIGSEIARWKPVIEKAQMKPE